MNNSVQTTCLRLSLLLCVALLFQGCAAHRPTEPIDYPAPTTTTTTTTTTQPREPPTPRTETKPTVQAPKQSRAAANFSRQAAEKSRQGNYDLAASIIERGLRIAPKDAMLWSELAEIRLRQQQYQQARSLATKSNSLAGTKGAVVEKNRWIIQESLKGDTGQ